MTTPISTAARIHAQGAALPSLAAIRVSVVWNPVPANSARSTTMSTNAAVAATPANASGSCTQRT